MSRKLGLNGNRHSEHSVGVTVTALLAAPDRRTWLGRRDHALLVLMVQNHVSVLTGLRIGDVHLGVVFCAHIRVTGRGRKMRSPTLSRETVAVIRAWLTERHGQPAQPLFPTRQGGGPLSRYTVGAIVARAPRTTRGAESQHPLPTGNAPRADPRVGHRLQRRQQTLDELSAHGRTYRARRRRGSSRPC